MTKPKMWAIVLEGTAVNPGLCKLHIDDKTAWNNAKKEIYKLEVMNTDIPGDKIFNAPFTDVTGNDEIECYVCHNKWFEVS